MKEITESVLESDNFVLFIHSPFCGTCHFAEAILRQIETVHKQDIFYEMNASFYTEFMQEAKVESVPCLLFKKEGVIVEKVYTFRSVSNIYRFLYEHYKQLFTE